MFLSDVNKFKKMEEESDLKEGDDQLKEDTSKV